MTLSFYSTTNIFIISVDDNCPRNNASSISSVLHAEGQQLCIANSNNTQYALTNVALWQEQFPKKGWK